MEQYKHECQSPWQPSSIQVRGQNRQKLDLKTDVKIVTSGGDWVRFPHHKVVPDIYLSLRK